ncbi:RNase III endonuclease [Synechococcus phage S-CRES3]|nr:RNase III endonuclease [Synechococcus phage S-CRES3]
MKNALFQALSYTTYAGIWLCDKVGTWTVTAIAYVFGWVRWLIANTGQLLMKTLTPAQWAEVQGQLELSNQQTELELLSTASQLKEHAEELGEWTDSHTEALEAIGQALLNECNWEEENVHGWMRRLVESIPGLTYEEGPEGPVD